MDIKAVCFGEVLWDIFPDKERIGGAPMNVALRLNALGLQCGIISRIGKDEKGKKILDHLENSNVSTENIQEDPEQPTGVVNVVLDHKGSATYKIAQPAAWDKIEASDAAFGAVRRSEVFIFGSLACRDEKSRNTLYQLLPFSKYKVLDVNLRPPHFSNQILKDLMKKSDLVKCNDKELLHIAKMISSKGNTLEDHLNLIATELRTESICVTKGSQGALLLIAGKLYQNPGYDIVVKDTVGAGDSFLAGLIAKLLQKKNPQEALDYACALGALVAGEEGANPSFTTGRVEEFMLTGR